MLQTRLFEPFEILRHSNHESSRNEKEHSIFPLFSGSQTYAAAAFWMAGMLSAWKRKSACACFNICRAPNPLDVGRLLRSAALAGTRSRGLIVGCLPHAQFMPDAQHYR